MNPATAISKMCVPITMPAAKNHFLHARKIGNLLCALLSPACMGTRVFRIHALLQAVVVCAAAFGFVSGASAQIWCTVLEQSPNAAVVTDSVLREKIVESGFPWRVRDNASGIEMLLVPAGIFQMGASPEDSEAIVIDETPVHQVTLTKAFYLGKTEITQGQYGGGTSTLPRNLSWNSAQAFCTAKSLRLPTSAEWEFACRAGTITPRYGVVNEISWNITNSDQVLHSVATKLPNALGLYDMLGSLSEFCADYWDAYTSENVVDPQGPISGFYHVFRGGSFLETLDLNRASCRGGADSWQVERHLGFRVARTPAASDFPDFDGDGDGVPDFRDNCVNIANPLQADCDNDGIGDACELAGTSPYPGAVQWTVASGGNGHWYMGVPAPSAGVNWTDARTSAISIGGDLVSLNTLQERAWVFANVANNSALWTTTLGPWVGGYQPAGSSEPNGGWMWVDGTTLSSEFAWGDPPDGNNNCGGAANRMTYWGNYTIGAGDSFHDCADNAVFTCWNIDFYQHPSYIVEWSTGLPTESDCNNNGIPDPCDMQSGVLKDLNLNGYPDSCEIAGPTGGVVAWGANGSGQCNIPVAAQSGVSAIAGGGAHTIALKDGAVLAWGYNGQGQCTIPAYAHSGVIAIAGGGGHTITIAPALDANNNNRPDTCDMSDDPSLDRNNNGIMDMLEIARTPAIDCNRNSIIDEFDLLDHPEWDCNLNGRVDTCDFAEGASDDNLDGHLDTCQWAKGDLDLSGIVDSGDFSILLLYYGEENPLFGDFDGSGMIDSGDAAVMLLYFGEVTWP